MPAFNHTRSDSPLTPCDTCRAQMTPTQLETYRLGVEAELAAHEFMRPLDPQQLEGLEWYAHSSGTPVPQMVRNAILSLINEVMKARGDYDLNDHDRDAAILQARGVAREITSNDNLVDGLKGATKRELEHAIETLVEAAIRTELRQRGKPRRR